MDKKAHWENIYSSKENRELSWTQDNPSRSLSLITKTLPHGRIIDIGGGTSLLTKNLLQRGYTVTVLDISAEALERMRTGLGQSAEKVTFITADITSSPELETVDLWHDRAVFHFLTAAGDREAYKTLLLKTLAVGGYAIIATFAPDGPEKCSGLDVQRYDGKSLAAELGAQFQLLEEVPETHKTPWGSLQSFSYCLFKRLP